MLVLRVLYEFTLFDCFGGVLELLFCELGDSFINPLCKIRCENRGYTLIFLKMRFANPDLLDLHVSVENSSAYRFFDRRTVIFLSVRFDHILYAGMSTNHLSRASVISESILHIHACFSREEKVTNYPLAPNACVYSTRQNSSVCP